MNTKVAHVKVNNQLSDSFRFNAGVKQGDGLSTTLFILALHRVVRNIDRGTIFTKSSQICAYADDIAIMARYRNKLIQVFKELEQEATKTGLKINDTKTKYMIMQGTEGRRGIKNLQIGDRSFERVSDFTYLGNMIENSDSAKCIKERITIGNRAYNVNRMLFNSKMISRACKLMVVTYGSETWTLTKGEGRLRLFERKVLRKIDGPISENGIWRIRYNEELNKIIQGEDIVRYIKSRRIRWLGHVERMEVKEMPKRMLHGKLYTRKRRRPKNQWSDGVIANLKKTGVIGWKQKTKDRDGWR
jgi:hypothetical protein